MKHTEYSYFITVREQRVFPDDNAFASPEEAMEAARNNPDVPSDEHFGILECVNYDSGGRLMGIWKPCGKTVAR